MKVHRHRNLTSQLSIAVIVRTKDRPHLLRRSLASLAEQKRVPDEVIVINDGGVTVDTLVRQYTQLNIQLINHETAQGRARAGNRGVAASHSDVIGFLDDDDRWLTDHLQRLEKALLLFDAQVAYSGCRLVQRDTLGDKVILREQAIGEFNEPFEAKRLRYENYIPLINILIDRALWQHVGGFDESFEVFEDWDLLCRLAQHTAFYHVQRVTAEYAIWGPGQITQGIERQRWLNAYEHFLAKHWLPLPQTQQLAELAEYWRICQERRGIVRQRLEENRGLQVQFLDNLQKLEDTQRQLHRYQEHHSQLQQHITQIQGEWRQKYEQLQRDYAQLQTDWNNKYEQQQFHWQQKHERVHTEAEQKYQHLQADWTRKYEQLHSEYTQVQHDWKNKYEHLQNRYEHLQQDWVKKYEQLQINHAQLQADWTHKYEQLQQEHRQSEWQLEHEWRTQYQQLQTAYDQQEAHFKQQQQDMLQEIDRNITLYNQLHAQVQPQQQQCQDLHQSVYELQHQLTLGLTQGNMERILSTQPPRYSGQLDVEGFRINYQRLAHWCQEHHQQYHYWAHLFNGVRGHAEVLQAQLHQITTTALHSRWLHYGGYVKMLDKINLSAEALNAKLDDAPAVTEFQDQALPPPRPLSGLQPNMMTFGGELGQPQLMEAVTQQGETTFHLGANSAFVFAVYCSIDGFFRIDLALATYMRINACQIRLVIRRADKPEPIRVVHFSALSVIDNLFHPIYFEPIGDSAGKTYHLEFDSPDASDQQAIAIWCSNPILPEVPATSAIPLPSQLPHWLQQGVLEAPLPTQLSPQAQAEHIFVITGVNDNLSLPVFLNHLGKVLQRAHSSGQVVIAGELNTEIQAYCDQHQLLTLPVAELAAIIRWGQQSAAGELLWYCHVHALPPLEAIERVKELLSAWPTAALAVPMQIQPHSQRISGGYALIDQYGNLHHFPLNQPADHPYHGYRRVIDAASSDLLIFKTQYLDQLEADMLTAYNSIAYQVTEVIWQLKAAQLDTVYDAACYYNDEREPTPHAPNAVDRALLFQRWQSALQPGLIVNQHTLMNPHQLPTLLIIDATLPAYDEDSGSLRLYILMKLFIKLGYKVTFFPDNLDSQLKYRQALQALGVEVFHGDYNIVTALSYRSFTLAIVCRVEMGQRYIPFLRLISPKTRIFYDTIDIHYIREQRQAEIEDDAELAAKAQMTQRKELANCLLADRTLTVTEEDAVHLQKELPHLTYSVIPNVHPLQQLPDTTFEQREGLVFIGNYHHHPNEDSVYFFIDEVLPRIQAQLPDICLYLIGSNMKPKMKALTQPGVNVIGWVDHVQPEFAKRRVFVSYLRYGAGMKGKLGQALSLGLPIVTTSIGAEGMGLQQGETALIADDPAQFAAAVCQLYGDKALWEKLSSQGRDYIEHHYGETAVYHKLQQVLA